MRLWSKLDGAIRHIALRADNKNVFHRVSKSKAKLGAPNRAIRRLVDYLVQGILMYFHRI